MNDVITTTNKTPIEIALQIDDNGFTTTKRLYAWLELDQSHYARWVKENITDNPFAEENEYSPCMAKPRSKGADQQRIIRLQLLLRKEFLWQLSLNVVSRQGFIL